MQTNAAVEQNKISEQYEPLIMHTIGNVPLTVAVVLMYEVLAVIGFNHRFLTSLICTLFN